MSFGLWNGWNCPSSKYNTKLMELVIKIKNKKEEMSTKWLGTTNNLSGHRCLSGRLSPLSPYPAGQLDVLGHDSDTLGVDGAQVGVLKQANQVSLASFLLGQRRGLKERSLGTRGPEQTKQYPIRTDLDQHVKSKCTVVQNVKLSSRWTFFSHLKNNEMDPHKFCFDLNIKLKSVSNTSITNFCTHAKSNFKILF